MLVLNRNVDEEIRIGNDIVIKIVRVDSKQGKVRLGISAPREVTVHRQEVFDEINRDKETV